MPTDKEAAAAYRLLAEYHQSEHEAMVPGATSAQALTFTERANVLDPPKPIYADGTVAWVTDSMGDRWISVRASSGWWNRSDAEHSGYVGIVKVEPLRVLADDEIAIKRTEDTSVECLDALIEKLRHCEDSQHVITRSILGDIRNAAVEAGDAK